MGQTPQQGQQLNDNHLTLLTAPISPCCPGRRPLTPRESHAAAVPPGQQLSNTKVTKQQEVTNQHET
ncbi:hypothetical protein ROHU_011419 [Labeo rohita]|uniref:Uncharacterized protein n=1 Tax=Labeo rohita TaxID=84645 RepID=A0A498LKX9_LABRO|nr:hypothetical protein ROHU_011419 [Labeo rohita]